MGHVVTGLDCALDPAQLVEENAFFARDAVLSHLEYWRPHLHTAKASTASVATPASLSLAIQISTSTTQEQIHAVSQTALIKKLSRSLMMDASEIDAAQALSIHGMDSLVAVEMKN
ncbi:hypothetical protein CC86DRAFT_407446 [Ophiobolus disseminans]|uniref:Carrier domain-containing protein n=1 Tax=Ophiobolus disseminans TaxID=1469910 RepID=A0A6A6ZWI6_9PLEO|nr:hypothetical protein CC86DRAFT_407446 [Ophiobolus disseminans]